MKRATNQVVTGCENLLQKVESSSTFATKSVHVARFTGPRQTCFATSDVTPVYGVSPAKFYPIKSQYSRNLQQPDLLRDRFDSWVVKRATSLFHSLGSNVAKQVARFCCPVGLNILWCSVTQSTSTYISYVQVWVFVIYISMVIKLNIIIKEWTFHLQTV